MLSTPAAAARFQGFLSPADAALPSQRRAFPSHPGAGRLRVGCWLAAGWLSVGCRLAAGRAPAPDTDGAARPLLPALEDAHGHPRPPPPRALESAAAVPLPGTGRTTERSRTSPIPVPAAPIPPGSAAQRLPASPRRVRPPTLTAQRGPARSCPARRYPGAGRLGAPPPPAPAARPGPPRATAFAAGSGSTWPGRLRRTARRGRGARRELLEAAEDERAAVPQEFGRRGGGCDVIEGKTPPRAKPTRC